MNITYFVSMGGGTWERIRMS